MNGSTISSYFQRDAQHILDSIDEGHGCIVVGGVKRGKSQLLRAVRDTLEQSPRYDVIYHKLTEPEIELNGAAQFFKSLTRIIRKTLRDSYAKTSRDGRKSLDTALFSSIKSSTDYTHLLVSLVQHSVKDIVYIVDNPQSIPPNLIVDLLDALYAAIEQTQSLPTHARFIVVLSGTIELEHIAASQIKAFESHDIHRVTLDDLTWEEARALVEEHCVRCGILQREEGLNALLAHTGFDYYLIDQVMKTCCDLLTDDVHERYLTPPLVQRSIDAFVAHFDPTEVLARYFQRSAKVLDMAIRFLKHHHAESGVLLNPTEDDLTPALSGLFKSEGSRLDIKCPLWERLLKAHLTPLTIGRYYVLHREWYAALEYLGRAYHEALETNDNTAPLIYEELRAAILKAMYASEIPPATDYKAQGPIVRPLRAVDYLLRGLTMLYPQSQPHLYVDGIENVYPPTALDKHITPSVYENAIGKAEYSIVRFNGNKHNTLQIGRACVGKEVKAV